MIPSAPAAFNCGINSRTTCSSMIVSTATQPGWLRGDTVGLRKAGKLFNNFARFLSAMFIFRPTFASASSAPCNNKATLSIFPRFQRSFHAARLAINRGVETSSVSTIRGLFARKEEPVSVISTIASTSSCALTSVAPQENSTSAFTPCCLRYFFVRFTISVATRLPFKSFADLTGEFSGTDRKSTRLNSSHGYISYAVFCLKKKNLQNTRSAQRLQHHHTP